MKTTGIWMDGDNVIQRQTENVESVLEHVKDLRSANEVGSGEMWHVAKLPRSAIMNYCHSAGITFSEFMRNDEHLGRMLNDPALAGFRIHQGRV